MGQWRLSRNSRCTAAAVFVLLVFALQSQGKMVSFADFIRDVKHAEAKDFLNRPGAVVKDAEAFEQMRSYILKLYGGVHVQRSYEIGTQMVDCVPENEQPSLRGQASSMTAVDDEREPAATEGCGSATIPMRRITLEELTRFRTLEDYLHKAPHGEAPVPPGKRP